MAKRRSDADGVVRQLRPDDSGWLAELRRARTEQIDLAGEIDEERARWADEPTHGGAPPGDDADAPGIDDRPSAWAPAPRDESSEPVSSPQPPALPPPVPMPPPPLSAPPMSPRPISIPPLVPVPISTPPVSPAPRTGRPMWTMAVPESLT